jgi:hypothetical protein
MVHFAELDGDNIVQRVIVCDSKEWCETHLGGTWVRTFYATEGKTYAGIGYKYHPDLDNFSPPQPYPSWELNTATMSWEPPVPYPQSEEGGMYDWDEAAQEWVALPTEQE